MHYKIYIDGTMYKIKNIKSNLLEVCLSLGFDIPYFCWHPELGSVGACRQCAIKHYKDKYDSDGKIVMSCMTPVENNLYISIIDNEVKKFRRSILELLMINHPHDCPVCEEGGNCHLQDITVMTGHNSRRYRFTKRTHYNQYLGPFISHEMNRCITCYRCIRFYRDYADGKDLGVYGISNNVYFGRFQEGTLENEFSGNLVEICPTGVFTDKTYSKRYYRKWDMQYAPSICQQCSVGCNITVGERDGKICRIENRYNKNVNRYFLCDLGRFGYDYLNLEDRPNIPKKKKNNTWIKISIKEAIRDIAKIFHSSRTIGIGSARASIESNFALMDLVGANNFYAGISDQEEKQLNIIVNVLFNSGIYVPSLYEIEEYDAILVLGEDITQTGSRIALAIRQAIKRKANVIAKSNGIFDWQSIAIKNISQGDKYPLFITNVDKTCLDDIANWSYYASVHNQAKFGFAIANIIDSESPNVFKLNSFLRKKANIIAKLLCNAKKPLIISGTSSGDEEIIKAATNIAIALKKNGNNVGISFNLTNVNSMGLAIMGSSGSLNDALNVILDNKVDNLVVLENDLYRHANINRVNSALPKLNNLIILDHQKNTLQDKANFILSSASFVESSGTVINQECRAQRFFKVYDPKYYNDKVIMLESWRWLHSIKCVYLNRKKIWRNLDDIVNDIEKHFPKLKGIKYVSPRADFRINGQKLSRKPIRYSGITSMNSHCNINEQPYPKDIDTMFSFSTEGSNNIKPSCKYTAFAWTPGWNSPQIWNKFQKEIDYSWNDNFMGVKLLKNIKHSHLDYFDTNILNIISCNKNSLHIAPYWHLFGNEETSQRSLIIQKRMLSSYATMNLIDADLMNIKDGMYIFFICMDLEFSLPVVLSSNLSKGQIGLPLGFPGIPPFLSGQKVSYLRKIDL